jgi:hypothetical protein
MLLHHHRIFSVHEQRKPRACCFLSALAAAFTLNGCGDRGRDQNTIRIGAIVEQTGDMPAVCASRAMRHSWQSAN